MNTQAYSRIPRALQNLLQLTASGIGSDSLQSGALSDHFNRIMQGASLLICRAHRAPDKRQNNLRACLQMASLWSHLVSRTSQAPTFFQAKGAASILDPSTQSRRHRRGLRQPSCCKEVYYLLLGIQPRLWGALARACRLPWAILSLQGACRGSLW